MAGIELLSKIKIRTHLLIAFIIRIVFILYGMYHDQYSIVPYTDVDYKVFTDAARHILDENSPFDRHTYRYSPLLAFLLTPNVVFHHAFGKILFCIVDIGVGLLIRIIVIKNLNDLKDHADKSYLSFTSLFLLDGPEVVDKNKMNAVRQRKRSKQSLNKKCRNKNSERVTNIVFNEGNMSMLLWLYNPMSIAISTRGNCDSLSSFIVLYTLYYLEVEKRPFLAGFIQGLSIHFRLYPIIYSLTMFMYLSKYSYYNPKNGTKATEKPVQSEKHSDNTENSIVQSERCQRRTIFKTEYLFYLIPNKDQLLLVMGCLLSLSTLTTLFYVLYGYQFLYETYIYHFTRIDYRHNFSLYFYLQYLTAWVKNIGLWQKVLMLLPQVVLLLVFSVRYGLNRFSFNFAIILQTIVFVIYNRVQTSQYFVWIMALLPLSMWQIRISFNKGFVILVIWYVAQAAWLLPAYLLEFKGENTFFFIWIQSISFFCANVAIMGRLLINFMYKDMV